MISEEIVAPVRGSILSDKRGSKVFCDLQKIERISPTGLVESEGEFISRLRQYLKEKKKILVSRQLYLLRNQPKSGVGFFNLSGFYPDFII